MHLQKPLVVAASYSSEPAGSSASILEAFYYGRAFAETLNERLGAALDDLLSELGKQDAERRESLRCSTLLYPSPLLAGCMCWTFRKRCQETFHAAHAWYILHWRMQDDQQRAACGRQFQEEVEERARRGLQEAGAVQPSSSAASESSSAAAPMTYRAGNSFMAGTGPATASSASGRPTLGANGRTAVIATPPDLQVRTL
jgi:hypothetical protein